MPQCLSWFSPRTPITRLQPFPSHPFRRHLSSQSSPQQHVLSTRTGSRPLTTSSVANKRAIVGPSKKSEKRTRKGSKGTGSGRSAQEIVSSLSESQSGSSAVSESSISLTNRPAYIKAPAVSAKEMVEAIESSRQKSILKSSPPSALDPFGKAVDPFSNQLDVAIEASLRGTGHSQGSSKKDSRNDRANTQMAVDVQIPDIQAQYLVGRARWESINAKDIHINNVTPKNRPKVAALEHGLDRVLFNPGVHWLQDPRSSVYNFDPYLRSICPPDNFDYKALPEYRTSSLDPTLFNMTHQNHGKYMGSTSSMTSILSQFYFLISGWKPLKTGHLSEAFVSQPKGFTRLCRAPSTIQLVYKGNGVYAIDADKTFDSSTVLMQLGKSMEKMLTTTSDEFARFTKANSWQVTKEEREQPEAFNYIAVDNFILRSQLDCEDSRLPGKTFDLKTRAAVAIRLDVHNYELNQGYQLRKAHGYLESFEREYYDMMRSAFLKYSLQVRIGQMDGIFVAFHNTARIFGFQYISLDEMDSRLFGSSVMGNECFKNQLRLLNRTLDMITAKYPEQDLKITVDTDETVQSMNVWVETMPLGASSSPQGQGVKVVFDDNGAPEMQPGAELSLWQVVCYSHINNIPTVGSFDLSERAADDWELLYKIAELKKPHMMNEYRRMMAIQAEILSDGAEKEALTAAAAAAVASAEAGAKKSSKTSRGVKAPSKTASRRDAMRSTLRRISEQGRIMEENKKRQQADKEFMVWEPKGYTKTVDVAASPVPEAVPAVSEPETKPEPANKTSDATSTDLTQAGAGAWVAKETVAQKMLRKLKEAAGAPHVHYRRGSDNQIFKLQLDDLYLIRKSLSHRLVNAELSRFQELMKEHQPFIKSLSPFDEVRFKMLEVPVRLMEYQNMDRDDLIRLAKLMGQPETVLDTPSNELRQLLFNATPRFRNMLHLDYFHNWVHKVASRSENAEPFKGIKDLLAVEEGRMLLRIANGINVNSMMTSNVARAQGLAWKDSIKKAVLNQVYYSEIVFSDDELKTMGYYPRIFDPEQYKSTRDIMKDAGTKYRKDDAQKLSEASEASEASEVSSSPSSSSSSSSASSS
ncbi:hypothetical protein BG011_004920 [Mortierella polycephala]|uniref:Pet127-domain-containing protein n=1 Tax=Mortierella polycephala TaxID=41804 RepID=A0A9P6PX19_9FUNG|nr:hypothetical protein BG011_004920 [Mortierella polycephala]